MIMYEIFCKYSYDYYFPHTIKEVFKEYTTRARPNFSLLNTIF